MSRATPPKSRPSARNPGTPSRKRAATAPATGEADLLAQLAARVAALEAAAQTAAPAGTTKAAPAAAPALDAERFWILDRLTRSSARGGEVAYAGSVTTPTGEQYLWQRHATAGKLFEQDWTALTGVLAALGHPVRLQLLHHILHGRTTKAELERIPGLGTTGQLYHHLKALQEAGWVRSLERGTYAVPGERVVPFLAILAAAAG